MEVIFEQEAQAVSRNYISYWEDGSLAYGVNSELMLASLGGHFFKKKMLKPYLRTVIMGRGLRNQ